jgi:hypothetical protein
MKADSHTVVWSRLKPRFAVLKDVDSSTVETGWDAMWHLSWLACHHISLLPIDRYILLRAYSILVQSPVGESFTEIVVVVNGRYIQALEAHNLEIVITKLCRIRDCKRSLTPSNKSTTIPDFQLHLPRAHAVELELVETLYKVHLAQLICSHVNNGYEVRVARLYQHNTADGIFRVFSNVGGFLEGVGASSANSKRMVPKRCLDALPIRRHHVLRVRITVLPHLDERFEDGPVPSVIVCVCQGCDFRGSSKGLGPYVAHVMALAGIVPCLELDDIGLEGEGLAHAVFEVLLAAAVPVVILVQMLELDWRHSHHEYLVVGLCGAEECRVYRGGYGDLAVRAGGPRVPVKHAVESAAGREEGFCRVVDCVETWYDEYIAYRFPKGIPLLVRNILGTEGRNKRLVLQASKVRIPGFVLVEVVGIIGRAVEMAGSMVEREKELEAQVVGMSKEAGDGSFRPVCELVEVQREAVQTQLLRVDNILVCVCGVNTTDHVVGDDWFVDCSSLGCETGDKARHEAEREGGENTHVD